jgi:hypothetical protein
MRTKDGPATMPVRSKEITRPWEHRSRFVGTKVKNRVSLSLVGSSLPVRLSAIELKASSCKRRNHVILSMASMPGPWESATEYCDDVENAGATS